MCNGKTRARTGVCRFRRASDTRTTPVKPDLRVSIVQRSNKMAADCVDVRNERAILLV